MADDRVRMKSLTVFNNPIITVHRKEGDVRPDNHTVIEDDEFSTSEVHAGELERLGLAERIEGEPAPASEHAERLLGAQTSGEGGVFGGRPTTITPLGGKPAAANPVAKPAA